jgi:hypothetical protein
MLLLIYFSQDFVLIADDNTNGLQWKYGVKRESNSWLSNCRLGIDSRKRLLPLGTEMGARDQLSALPYFLPGMLMKIRGTRR